VNIAQIKQKVDSLKNAVTHAWLTVRVRSADLYACKAEAEGLADCMEQYLNELKLAAAQRQKDAT
jgi:hypothetical protein